MTYDPYQHQQRMQDIPPQGYWPQQQPPAPQPRHRRPRGLWVAVIAVLVIAAAGSTAWALGVHSAAAPTCHQQYESWKAGPVSGIKATMNADLASLQSASDSADIPAMTSALRQLGQAAGQLRQYPMPACADPAGYWPRVVADMKAAGDNAGAGSGLGALLTAVAPIRAAQPLEAKLRAELARTAQVK